MTFGLDGVEVHRTFLRVPGLSPPMIVGPELTDDVRISGQLADGTPTATVAVIFNENFLADTTRDYVIVPGAAPAAADIDGDGLIDLADNCPSNSNSDQADADGDGIGDACDTTSDADNDGVLDGVDNCAEAPNVDQADGDGDGIGDVCDIPDDADNDDVPDAIDNCAEVANTEQADADEDGIGDACDESDDADEDGVLDDVDNCVESANEDQADADEDGDGDACDDDIDGDGILNDDDNCPEVANSVQTDNDADGEGNECDDTPNGVASPPPPPPPPFTDCNSNGIPDGQELIASGGPGVLYGGQGGEACDAILFTLDPTTGLTQSVVNFSDLGFGPSALTGLTATPDGRTLYGSVRFPPALVRFDTLTQQAVLVGEFLTDDIDGPVPVAISALALLPDGRLIGSAPQERALVEIAPATAEVSFLCDTELNFADGVIPVQLSGLTVSSGGTLYGTTASLPLVQELVTVDLSGGPSCLATLVGGPSGFSKLAAVAFGPGGVLYGGTASGQQLINFNINTGVGTLVHDVFPPDDFCALDALEFVTPPRNNDCNANQIPDECDIAGGLGSDCDGNGRLDDCEAITDCNDNSVADACDVANGTSADCQSNGIPDECDVAAGTGVLYAVQGGDCCGGRLYRVNPATAETTLLVDLEAEFPNLDLCGPSGVALSPDRRSLYISLNFEDALIRHDIESGQTVLVGSFENASPSDIAFLPDGTLVVSDPGDNALYDIDPENGIDTPRCATVVVDGAQNVPVRISGLAVSPSGVLYGSTGSNSGTPAVPAGALLIVDPTPDGDGECVATLIGSGTGFNRVAGIAFAPDGRLFGATARDEELIRIDPLTGVGTLINQFFGDPGICSIDGLQFVGGSSDCNENEIPDECDIANCGADPNCRDCNENGVPDGCEATADALIGPIPYLSGNDSPFVLSGIGGPVLLENFEDGALNIPGVSANGSVIGPGGLTDSVDADDGAIDGSGSGGSSYFNGDGAAGITFIFDSQALGGLPTRAGIVWTDGSGTTRFEAFDAQDQSLGVLTGNHADGSSSGTTGEDQFYGVTHSGGILSLHISNSAGGIEVDHLQYGGVGAAGQDCNANGIPDECDIAGGSSTDVNANGRPDECEAPLLFVDRDAVGNDDGTSWEDAYEDLPRALAAASASGGLVTEIWVADGVYTPAPPNGDRTASFQLLDEVALRGGFRGDEDPATFNLANRDFDGNRTVLSGDLNFNDSIPAPLGPTGENSYSVVLGGGTNAKTVLDGFTISDGNADGPGNNAGGGIRIENGSPTISNCKFENNRALFGGAMYNLAGSPAVTNCRFNDNAAGDSGGGVINSAGSQPTFTACQFLDNQAGTNGGGGMLSNSGSQPTLSLCDFQGNTAMLDGGALATLDGRDTLTDCTFSNNRAGVGAAVYELNTTSEWTNCTLQSNVTTVGLARGGGLYAESVDMTLTACVFDQNVADLEGGGLYLLGGSMSLAACQFDANRANNADTGGGMVVDGAIATLDGCFFTGNTCPFGSAGALYNTNGSALTLNDCHFNGNIANSYGGAIRTESSVLTATDCTFMFNQGRDGGAVASFMGSPTFTRCTFSGNNNGNFGRGGAAYNDGSSPMYDQCNFDQNHATGECGEGGAMINLNDSGPLILNSSFTHNVADARGGAIQNESNSNPIIINAAFVGNEAKGLFGCTARGGAIVNDSSNLICVNCVFNANNAANGPGGAIMESQGGSLLINSTLVNNQASAGGGLFAVISTPAITNCIFFNNFALGGGPDEAQQIDGDAPSLRNVDYSFIQGLTGQLGGTGNIGAGGLLPGFVDFDGPNETAGDIDDLLDLAAGSPCIDAGDSDTLSAKISTDFAGRPRFVDDPATTDTGAGTPAFVDMGAYEFQGIMIGP
ncbi:MAG: hypothetical protein HOP29_17525 [Phycisphaerales bacterium]|nr:hypothetical protein [Phycisphaerales bacterium]